MTTITVKRYEDQPGMKACYYLEIQEEGQRCLRQEGPHYWTSSIREIISREKRFAPGAVQVIGEGLL
jgi:hypothetical protein